MIKEKTKLANKFYNSLTFEIASKVGAIVTTNKKLESTATKKYKVAGVSLYPAFKKSCSNATSCKDLCIAFTGIGQISAGSKHTSLTNIDKAQLKRLWLFNNKKDYFYNRAKTELDILSNFGEQKILFREITSECIDYNFFENIEYVTTYGYFKDSTKIDQNYKKVNMPKLPIYSWNEKSRIGLIEYLKNNLVPIAVVVPKHIFKQFHDNKNNDFTTMDNFIFHNGDKTDLNSTWNLRTDKINIHLLSEKTARYSKVIERPEFLNSWKKLFSFLGFECNDESTCKYLHRLTFLEK